MAVHEEDSVLVAVVIVVIPIAFRMPAMLVFIPTIYDCGSSSAPALRVVHDVGVRPGGSRSHDAQWLCAACGSRAQDGGKTL
jgi:hypothetical protein